MAKTFQLNQQLDNDTHRLFEHGGFLMLLHKNATIPWIIIVPKTEVLEVYHLPEEQQKALNKLTKQIADYLKQKYNVEKMNIAAIGNIVSQLHIHIIGRKTGDACWPDVVWGNDYGFIAYTKNEILEINKSLSKQTVKITAALMPTNA